MVECWKIHWVLEILFLFVTLAPSGTIRTIGVVTAGIAVLAFFEDLLVLDLRDQCKWNSDDQLCEVDTVVHMLVLILLERQKQPEEPNLLNNDEFKKELVDLCIGWSRAFAGGHCV